MAEIFALILVLALILSACLVLRNSLCIDDGALLLYNIKQQVVQVCGFFPRGIQKERVQLLESFNIIIVVSHSLSRIEEFWGVYPTQRVLVVDTDHCHLCCAKSKQVQVEERRYDR
jgi:hypothetical protein